MPLTAEEMVFRALRIARAGASVSESRLFDDDAYLLIENAMHELARRVSRNAEKRSLMMRVFSANAISGGLFFSSPTHDGILLDALRWSRLYDSQTDPDQLSSYQYRAHVADLKRPYLNPVFGYYALQAGGGSVITRKKGIDDPIAALAGIDGTPIVLFCSYIPDFAGSNPLAAEFEDDAVQILADLLLAKRNANQSR